MVPKQRGTGEQEEEKEQRFSTEVFVRFSLEKTKSRLFRGPRASCCLWFPLPLFGQREETGPAVEIIYCLGVQGTPHTSEIIIPILKARQDEPALGFRGN